MQRLQHQRRTSMRNKLIELIQESVDGCARYWASVIADHLIASIRELDAEQEAGLTIRNLQLESEVKQLRSKLAESAPQWIPVSERLPKVGQKVVARNARFDECRVVWLIEYPFEEYMDWTYDGDHAFYLEYFDLWMPLPEPPQEEV